MWRKLFLLLIAGEIIIGLVIYVYSNQLEAATVIIRPTADGPTVEWTGVPPLLSHYSLIDDNVTQPNSGDVNDTISVLAVGKNGAEVEQLFFDIPRPFDAITNIKLWVYGENVSCNGSGTNKCDTIKVQGSIASDTLTLKDALEFNVGSYSWVNVGFNTTSTDAQNYLTFLDSQSTTTLKITFTRNVNGGGNSNNDNLLIAAAYIELSTSPERGGSAVEIKAQSIQVSGATSTTGGTSLDTTTSTQIQISTGSTVSGGENSE